MYKLIKRFSTTPSSNKLGVIGLGKIGNAMAQNFLKAGYNLTVFDIDSSATGKLESLGATVAKTAEEVAKLPVFVSVLPNDKILTSVVDEISSSLTPATTHISCSTVSPHTSRFLAENYNASFVAAPVFGRPDGMLAAQGSIPISGDAGSLDLASEILSTTATGVFDFGTDPGAANVVKLCGNFLIAAAIESMSESLALAEANGVDRVEVMKMLNETIFDCLIYKGYGQRVSERDHFPYEDAHFALELGLKDVKLVQQTASLSNTPMPVGSLLVDRYLSAKAKGREKFDWSAIGLNVSEDAGVDVNKVVNGIKEKI
eukprot:maker-scaffold_6-snap-gene-6.7-mRNA-1 protein AED:0.15 eAED:0.15 QI:71/1/1/1/1/1/4/109/315